MRDQAESLRLKLLNKANNSEAKAIAVVSGKGGVGKSNFSLNFALGLSEGGAKVLLFDMDIGMGNIDILMGMNAKHSIIDLFEHNLPIHDIIEVGPGNLSYIAGGTAVTNIFKMEDQRYHYFLEQLQSVFENYEYIIFDLGAGISEESLKITLAAHELVVVTTPEPTSMTDAYAMIKYIHLQKRDLPFYVLVNRTYEERQAIQAFKRLQRVAEQFLKRQLMFLGDLPDDRSVLSAVSKQIPFLLYDDRSAASKAMKEIVKRYQNKSLRVEGTSKHGFISRLKRFLTER